MAVQEVEVPFPRFDVVLMPASWGYCLTWQNVSCGCVCKTWVCWKVTKFKLSWAICKHIQNFKHLYVKVWKCTRSIVVPSVKACLRLYDMGPKVKICFHWMKWRKLYPRMKCYLVLQCTWGAQEERLAPPPLWPPRSDLWVWWVWQLGPTQPPATTHVCFVTECNPVEA